MSHTLFYSTGYRNCFALESKWGFVMEKYGRGIKIVEWIATVFLTMSILYFVLGELVSEKEFDFKVDKSNLYNEDWEMVLQDEQRMPIKVPGSYDVKSGDLFIIEKKIADDFNGAYLCTRSSQQDIKVYVDGVLRSDYSTKNKRKFGKNSVSVFIFIQLLPEDAGKTLRMELVSHSTYSGYINDIYCGDREQIWTGIVKSYLPVTLLAIFMLLLSVMVIIYSIIIKVVYKKKMNILYLGVGLLVASVWLIAESKLRQIFLPSSTVASDVGFLMVMLLPLPFLIYINRIQKRRYEKAYAALGILAAINFVISTALQFADIKDFSETMMSGHFLIVVLIIIVFVTVLLDVRNKHIKDYKEVSLGMAGLMAAGVFEIYMVYDKFAIHNGVGLCIGLAFLFFMAVIQTGRDLLELEKEKQIAVAASESRTMFLANMSHEIRTPINTIVGMNEMILRENLDNDTREYAENIENASKLLMGLIDDILDFSKLDAGKLEIYENPYNVIAMLKDVFLGASVRLEDKALEVKLDIDENVPTILNGDEIRIKQIFNNLLTNAIKYTVEGSIAISLKGISEEIGFMLEFTVADTGVGIKEEDIPTLFDSFSRMEMKRNKYIQGTGLGLSITKQLVDNMGGTIKVDSVYGKGSTFTVTIPQLIVDDTPIGNFEEAYFSLKDEGKLRETIRFGSEQSVLIVDDNEMNLRVMSALLGKTGLKLDFASGGNECVEKCKEYKYDLIFMDHMMPEPDGIETLHIIREDTEGKNRDTKVIVLTANAIKGAAEQYQAEGFVDYITKPVEYARLEQLLIKYLADSTIEDDNKIADNDSNDSQALYVLNKEEGLKYCGGLEDLYEEVLGHYIKNASEYKEELKICFEDKNWKDYARIAHTLKSNALTIGLPEFSKLAKEQEFAGKEANEKLIMESFENFISCLEESIKVVSRELG